MTEIRGLTLRQPWAYAVASCEKRIENRGWPTTYRGWIAIHASKSAGPRDEYEAAAERVAYLARIPLDIVEQGMQTRSAIVAVARLTGICSDALRPEGTVEPVCGCGPWAVNGQRHFILADVKCLVRALPCKGALGLWRLPSVVEEAVRDQVRVVLS